MFLCCRKARMKKAKWGRRGGREGVWQAGRIGEAGAIETCLLLRRCVCAGVCVVVRKQAAVCQAGSGSGAVQRVR